MQRTTVHDQPCFSMYRWGRVLYCINPFGYIINKTGAKKFVDFINANGIKHGIDYLMFRYAEQMGLNQYECVPRLIFSEFVSSSKKVDSDIQYDRSGLF